MIRFVVAAGHGYTLRPILDPPHGVDAPPAQLWSYRNLFASSILPRGTWVFCDIERLAGWELRLAAEVARLMRQAGEMFRILNDPARAAARYELLLRLHKAGINDFRAWRAEDGVPPARYPVFLRIESNHTYPLSGLIDTPQQLEVELDGLAEAGIPHRGVLIVEYAGREYLPGVFRKFGAYRFGDRIVADHLVHDVAWAAKYGNRRAWTPERYAEEATYVRSNPHAGELMKAFEIGGIEYGRADYDVIDGKIRVWEINTNPKLPAGLLEKSPPERADAVAIARDRRLEALEALNYFPKGPPVPMVSKLLEDHWGRQKAGIPDMIRE